MIDLSTLKTVYEFIGEETLLPFISDELARQCGFPCDEDGFYRTPEHRKAMTALMVAMRRFICEFPFEEAKAAFNNKEPFDFEKVAHQKAATGNYAVCSLCGAVIDPAISAGMVNKVTGKRHCPCCSQELDPDIFKEKNLICEN